MKDLKRKADNSNEITKEEKEYLDFNDNATEEVLKEISDGGIEKDLENKKEDKSSGPR